MSMRIPSLATLAFVMLIGTDAIAQNDKDPVLMTVDGQEVTRSEFENIYKKNNREEAVTQEALDEYMELFINFKLKVREAESLGMDTVGKFIKELEGYRKQLARPYMADTTMTANLVKEAYERSKVEVRASHILVQLPAKPTAKDTAAAYKRIMAFRDRVMNGEAFEDVAGGKNGSDDPSARENKGDLGYFSALQMVYPFENAVFNTKIGEVSQPIRTRFGYHIIKVTDRRAARGQIKVAHIMVRSTSSDPEDKKRIAEQKINEVYEKVKEGSESFADLALKYSDDEGSARKGGELPMFSTGKMIEEFENVSFGLEKDGDVSEPFQSRYGWHIVKRLEYKGLATFEEMEAELKRKVSKDSRAQLSEGSFIKKLKEEYDYKENTKGLNVFHKLLNEDIFRKNSFIMDTVLRKDANIGEIVRNGVTYSREMRGTLKGGKLISVKSKQHAGMEMAETDTVVVRERHGGWKLQTELPLNKTLITMGDTTFTQADFATYLEQKQRKGKLEPMEDYLQGQFKSFANECVLNYEDSRLERKYPKFKALMQEYRDGILLFELTDDKVWSMAVKDTSGLKAFHEEHATEFMWPERVDATVYTCANVEVAKKTRKLVKKKKPVSEILATINAESQLDLSVESAKFAKGDNDSVDDVPWEEGISADLVVNDQTAFVHIKEVLQPMPKELEEAKGAITAAYQDHLEDNWIKELRAKYPYTVNKEVLYTIQ